MANQFSEVDKSIIHNLMFSKSHSQIASLLGFDVDDISELIEDMIEGTMIRTHQSFLDEQVQKRQYTRQPKYAIDQPAPKVKKRYERPKSAKQIERQERIQYQQMIQLGRERRRAQEVIPTKVFDMSNKKSVKIDRKTSILIGIDEDEEKAKQRYLYLLSHSKSIYKKDFKKIA